MKKGFIAVHRKMLDNPVVCKDTEHMAVWMYLLLNATHTNYDVFFQGERITLKPGQLLTGRKSIAAQLGVNESKVQRILKLFEIEQQIEQQTSNQNRLVSIVRWEDYQRNEQQIEQQMNNKRTTNEQRMNTNNNVNKVNKVKKEDSSKTLEKFHADTEEYKLADYLYKKILENDPKTKKPKLHTWAEHIDKLIRIDDRSPEDIEMVIDYVTEDDFWQSNILSTSKLRKQFPKVYIQAKKQSERARPKSNGWNVDAS